MANLPGALAEPTADYKDRMSLLVVRQHAPPLNAVPFRKAPATARGSRVLRDEDWMPSKWCLLAIVQRLGGREALRDELRGVREDSGQPLRVEVGALACAKLEALTKRRALEVGEKIVYVSQVSSR